MSYDLSYPDCDDLRLDSVDWDLRDFQKVLEDYIKRLEDLEKRVSTLEESFALYINGKNPTQ